MNPESFLTKDDIVLKKFAGHFAKGTSIIQRQFYSLDWLHWGVHCLPLLGLLLQRAYVCFCRFRALKKQKNDIFPCGPILKIILGEFKAVSNIRSESWQVQSEYVEKRGFTSLCQLSGRISFWINSKIDRGTWKKPLSS